MNKRCLCLLCFFLVVFVGFAHWFTVAPVEQNFTTTSLDSFYTKHNSASRCVGPAGIENNSNLWISNDY